MYFQDTNANAFRSYPAFLGVSKKQDLEMNSLTVPRKQGEAVGGVMKLSNRSSGKNITISIEYNQLSSVLNGQDEPTDSTGHSIYPGNINSLIFKISDYVQTLSHT